MISPPDHPEDAARIAALQAHEILDSELDARFQLLAEQAARVCDVGVALVSFVDVERVWFKARVGMEATEAPRALSFCGHTILADELLVVPDARKDERFHDNPLVTGALNVVFYAGAPVFASNGMALGSLCVVDSQPHELDVEQRRALNGLARQVEVLLQARQRAGGAASDGLFPPESPADLEYPPPASGEKRAPSERLGAVTAAAAWEDFERTVAVALEELALKPVVRAPDALREAGAPLRAASIWQLDIVNEIVSSIDIIAEPSFFVTIAQELFGPAADAASSDAVLLEMANLVVGAVKRSFASSGVALTIGLPRERDPREARARHEDSARRHWATLSCGGATVEIGIGLEACDNRRVESREAREGMVVVASVSDALGAVIVERGARLTSHSASNVSLRAAPPELLVGGAVVD